MCLIRIMLQDVRNACLTVHCTGVVMQRHNEDKLNEAFAQKCGVYLIFSVNMSGHFQGYARMMSYVSRQQVSSSPPSDKCIGLQLALPGWLCVQPGRRLAGVLPRDAYGACVQA